MPEEFESKEVAFYQGFDVGYDLGCHRERVWMCWLVFIGVALFGAGLTVGYLW